MRVAYIRWEVQLALGLADSRLALQVAVIGSSHNALQIRTMHQSALCREDIWQLYRTWLRDSLKETINRYRICILRGGFHTNGIPYSWGHPH